MGDTDYSGWYSYNSALR